MISILLLISIYYLPLSSGSGVPVLNYHQINGEAHNVLTLSPQEFDAQMAYLYKSGYTAISPKELVDHLQYGTILPENPILITFDDGYEDNYRVAYPILQKYHFTATFFIITDFAGNNDRYMTWKQISEMYDKGFSFESHTLSHLFLTNISNDDDILSQLIKSRESLEWHLKQKIEYLAYPGGMYDQHIIELAKQAGYRAAFTINLGRDAINCKLFTLNRIPIFAASHSFLRFWLRLNFTEIFMYLQNLKDSLTRLGAPKIASSIIIP